MATIAEEVEANARAKAEGYANAAAKEADASARSQAAGFSNAVAQEIDANKRAQAAGFRNAAEQEMDANRRSREAGFGNAALQEMDANRRAQAAGWANAAELETYGPIDAIRPTDQFLDPRLQPAPAIPLDFQAPRWQTGEESSLVDFTTGLQRTNIGFYLDEENDPPTREFSGFAPVEEDPTQALFDLFTLGKITGQTPYGKFQMNAPQKSFGFLFNERPAPFLGQNARVSPFVNFSPSRGMIGVRGDF